MKNRYYFFKRLFPEYVVIFLKGGRGVSCGIDRLLIKYIINCDICRIIVSSENQVFINKVKNNNYNNYVIREFIRNYLKNS